MPVRGLFLDRDGVINSDHGYVYQRDDFDFIDGVFDLVREARRRGYMVVVITNQAGIARGYYTEEAFHLLTAWMLKKFSEAGAPIDRVYFSPFHPTAGIGKYMKDDFSRKPHPGMIFEAQRDLDIDLGMSVLIGDKASDIRAGNAAGVGTNLFFAQQSPSSLDGLDFRSITTLRDAQVFLQAFDEPGGNR